MRNKKRTSGVSAAAGSTPKSFDNPSIVPLQHHCFEGECLTRFLESTRRVIESSRALDASLPHKFWIKRQFAVGVNEVTRVLERMPQDCRTKASSEEHFPVNADNSKAPCDYFQAVLIASDCNPRSLTKHLPALAGSRNVPIIYVKDRKEGSLRLGELIKLKTAIAIGVKAKGSALNQLVDEVLASDKVDSIVA